MRARRRRRRTRAYHWYRRRRAGASEVYIGFVPEAVRELNRAHRRRAKIRKRNAGSTARAALSALFQRVTTFMRRTMRSRAH